MYVENEVNRENKIGSATTSGSAREDVRQCYGAVDTPDGSPRVVRTGNLLNCVVNSDNKIIQKMKKLQNEGPPKPKVPAWQTAAYAHYEAEEDDEPEADNGSAAAASSSSSAASAAASAAGSAAINTLSAEAIPGEQAGTNGTLFVTRQNCKPGFHFSIECKNSSGGLVITGGHLTDESIPEGKEGRRVRDMNEQEIADIRRQAEAKQKRINAEQEKKAQSRRQQLSSASAAKEETGQVGEIVDFLKGKFKSKDDHNKISEVAIRAGLKNGWTLDTIKQEAGGGVAQLTANNDSQPHHNIASLQRSAKNKTGLPDQLKSGIEQLSGYSMDDVKVHFNSPKPNQLQAHAYAQGTDIHIAPGQEKHLPHEAWHIVQQKQGRVRPTLQMNQGVNVNDDKALEKEADVQGRKAMQFKMPDEKVDL